MNKILLLLVLFCLNFYAPGQVLNEKELNDKIDSIYKQLDPNDSNFDEKTLELLKPLTERIERISIIGDTSIIEGNDAAEFVQHEMNAIFNEANDSLYLSFDYANELPYLIIDLSGSDPRFSIDKAGGFSNIKILIIRGNLKSNSIDLDYLFTKIAGIPLTELYIVNCMNGVKYIPESIGNFTSLTKLGIFGNAIAELPLSLSKLTLLEELYVDANPISSLPNDIAKLTHLKILGIAKTNIPVTQQNKIRSLLPGCKILTE